ncbi:MAG: DUF58 domain-containing protein [Demequinaceae bacterium]|nr:DUF58 domain-containing protein [Demequinaceae bacterium]
MTAPAARESSSATVITSRGVGMAVAGLLVGGGGVGLASPVLVYIGVGMTSAVAVGCLWMLLSIHTFLLRFPFARRDVTPRPLTVGVPGKVVVSIESAHSHGREREMGIHPARRFTRTLVESLDIREQAAAELTGGAGTKATVSRSSQSLTLTYNLLPARRGRWPLGPALVHSSDPLGILQADTSVGGAELIPVWPATVDLSATAGALMGHADRIVLGARTPSPDDAALRDYREGDDLRRVHWKSTARRGTMVVRSDERAGRRPATVVMDLPRDSEAIEWTISASTSIALSVLDSGHPVRLLGGNINPEASHEDRGHSSALARASLLNDTVDLKVPISATAAERDLLRALREAALAAPSGEVIVGVFEPLSKDALDVLVPIGDSGRAWAIVRSGGDAARKQGVDDTLTALRRAGWKVTTAGIGSDLEQVWTTLLTVGGDME